MRSSFTVDVSKGHEKGCGVNVQRVDAGDDDQRNHQPSNEPEEVSIGLFAEEFGLGFAQEDIREVHLEKD